MKKVKILFVLLIMLATPALASAATSWIGINIIGNLNTSSDWWVNSANWDNGLPNSSLGAMDAVNNNGSWIFINPGDSASVRNFSLGGLVGQSGKLKMLGGTLNIDIHESVGLNGTGIFTQTGGTHNVAANLGIGRNADSEGTYNLSGMSTLTATSVLVGDIGTGTFTHTGGLHDITNYLYIGRKAVSNGSYELSGTGILKTGKEHIGKSGKGTFVQSGGSNTITDGLYLGFSAVGEGTYDLSAGTLEADRERIGHFGKGTFTQTGGSNTITGDLRLGNFNSDSDGSYELSGTGTLSANKEYIGDEGIGTFTQSGGTNTVTTDLYVGNLFYSNGSYELSDGALSAAREVIAYKGTGTFTQSGGTNTVTDTLTVSALHGTGTYDLSGGTLTVQNLLGTGEIINKNTFNYSGGTLDVDTFTNNDNFNISGPGTRTVNGNVVNNDGGIVKTTDTTAVFTGTFTNHGGYISDPSDNYFVDLIISSTGYLQGGVGDNWFVEGDFTNESTQSALWDTGDAYLGFIGGGAHTMELGGLAGGLDFAWGTMELLGGGSLSLIGTEMYVRELILGVGTSLDLGGATLYYTGLTDLGGSYFNGTLSYFDMGGASRPVVTPEPSTYLLLGSGITGLIVWRRKRKA